MGELDKRPNEELAGAEARQRAARGRGPSGRPVRRHHRHHETPDGRISAADANLDGGDERLDEDADIDAG